MFPSRVLARSASSPHQPDTLKAKTGQRRDDDIWIFKTKTYHSVFARRRLFSCVWLRKDTAVREQHELSIWLSYADEHKSVKPSLESRGTLEKIFFLFERVVSN